MNPQPGVEDLLRELAPQAIGAVIRGNPMMALNRMAGDIGAAVAY